MRSSRRCWQFASLALCVTFFLTLTARHSDADGSLDIPTFDAATLSNWTLNGSAVGAIDTDDGQAVLSLTNDGIGQAGSAFVTNALAFASDYSFSANFGIRLAEGIGSDCCGDPPGGEGITFVVHADLDGPFALGAPGGSLGLSGFNGIGPALVIEMDTQHVGAFDSGNLNVNGDHIAIDINTDDAAFPISIVQTGPRPLGAGLNDGQVKNIWIDYDGNTKNLQVFGSESTIKPTSPLLEQTVFLDRLFTGNNLYVGFTGATSLARGEQVVRNFAFDSRPSTSTIGPPPPNRRSFGSIVPAHSVSMNDFSDVSSWKLNGDAAATGDRLQLTESTTGQTGSAFLTNAFTMPADYAFNAHFAFEISSPGGASDVDGPGAHGMTFVIQADARNETAIGGAGGGLGLDGINPQVSVEFDTWDTGTFDDAANRSVNGTHIAINHTGQQLSVVQSPAPGQPGLTRINDGGVHYAWIEYDGTSMDVFFSDSSDKPASPALSHEMDLAEFFNIDVPDRPIINEVGGQLQAPIRFGFTAATGAAINAHEVVSFDLSLESPPTLLPGDSDMDIDFDQMDLDMVRQAGKYLTGQPATWAEGDWNGAPGGIPGSPPLGDGVFNQFDVVASLVGGAYLLGPYAALQPAGAEGDGQTSIVYDSRTGELAIDAPVGVELTTINIDSAAGIFTGAAAQNLGGSFDNDQNGNIFKATFGSSFGSLSFGTVAQTGLSADFLLGDLTVVGSLLGGGALGDVDLVYVPEPSPFWQLGFGVLGLSLIGLRRVRRYPKSAS